MLSVEQLGLPGLAVDSDVERIPGWTRTWFKVCDV
jgi:hypothetical protein